MYVCMSVCNVSTRVFPPAPPPHSRLRHILTLAPGFRLGRGTEGAVSRALETPAVKPRVLVIPQWCVDSEQPLEDMATLDVPTVKKLAQEGTAGICHPLTFDPQETKWLLRSDVMSPVIVVDLWSPPVLFLRHVEVTSWVGGGGGVGWLPWVPNRCTEHVQNAN